MSRFCALAVCLALLLGGGISAAQAQVYGQPIYSLNGQPMSAADAAMLMSNGLPPGNYRVDALGFVYAPGAWQPFMRVPVPQVPQPQAGGYPPAHPAQQQNGPGTVYLPGLGGRPGFSAGMIDGCVVTADGYDSCN